MHDSRDPRDLVPDEAEQLRLSGYEVGGLERDAAEAAANDDLDGLQAIYQKLLQLPRPRDSRFQEPDDEATLASLARAAPILDVDWSRLDDRIRGAWTGRAVGNTIGKPIEGLTRQQVEIYLRAADQWPLRGYVRLLDPLPDGVRSLHPSAAVSTAGNFTDVPRDDDIDWTILALHIMEHYGPDFTTEDVAHEWLDRIPFTQTFTAERAAYRNLVQGLAADQAALHQNPYREWIGALIRGDAFGYVHPGNPGAAALTAFKDARLSHAANGVYGELWAAAMCATALAATRMSEVVDVATALLPKGSRLVAAVHTISRLHGDGAPWQAALDWIDDELADLPWVHTINNAAVITTGLLWGSTFEEALFITIAGGRDTDSNGATVGSLYGALHGQLAIPESLVQPTHVRVRSAIRDFDRIELGSLADRTLDLACAWSAD